MKNYTFTLEPYNGRASRHTCPKCKMQMVFSRYINTETGQVLHPEVGRCNRESKCGYHRTPRDYFRDNPQPEQSYKQAPVQRTISSQVNPSYFPTELFQSSLKKYDQNHFITYLLSLFGESTTLMLIKKYYIGTSKHWEGATLFWQIDTNKKIRTGKIMLYDPSTGKRVKEPFNHINWAHKVASLPNYTLRQCFFGEHLVELEPFKPIGIVESEKTAIIASAYLPDLIWLAAGSLNNLNPEMCAPIMKRFITLFPDLNAYEKWRIKARELSSLGHFMVSDLLERRASEKEKHEGLDLADYLVRYNLKDFLFQSNVLIDSRPITLPEDLCPIPIPANRPKSSFTEKPLIIETPDWTNDILELEKFFSLRNLPDHPITIRPFTISDVSAFVQSHLACIKANNGNRTFLPYLDRLKELQTFMVKGEVISDQVDSKLAIDLLVSQT